MAALTGGRAEPGALRQVLGDARLWFLAVGLAALLALFAPWSPEQTPPLSHPTGEAGRETAPAFPDPGVRAVFSGTIPALDKTRTVGEAFARYPWFSAPPKWTALPPGSGASVLAAAPLTPPEAAARLGLGGEQAKLFYVVEFALSADAKSFYPKRSAVEVRDASNALVARVDDKDFGLLRRVLAGREPGVSLGLALEGR